MTAIGITNSSPQEGMVRLNVGGLHVNVDRSVLEGKYDELSTNWTFGNLFERK